MSLESGPADNDKTIIGTENSLLLLFMVVLVVVALKALLVRRPLSLSVIANDDDDQ